MLFVCFVYMFIYTFIYDFIMSFNVWKSALFLARLKARAGDRGSGACGLGTSMFQSFAWFPGVRRLIIFWLPSPFKFGTDTYILYILYIIYNIYI